MISKVNSGRCDLTNQRKKMKKFEMGLQRAGDVPTLRIFFIAILHDCRMNQKNFSALLPFVIWHCRF